jgi:D-amino-acid dehydrogenase
VRVAVVGAGIVGVTTAHALAAQGHEVVVFERAASVAAEGSFADAGLLAAGWVAPWAGPGLGRQVLRGLWQSEAPLRFSAGAALSHLPWLWRAWRGARPARQQAQRRALLALALFSRDQLTQLTRSLQLDYEQADGCLVLLRSAAEQRALQPRLELLQELGVVHQFVDTARARQLEPGLDEAAPLHGALHLPQGGAGNCRHFAHLLKTEAQRLGVRFAFGQRVTRLLPGTPAGLELAGGHSERCEAIVVCAGGASAALLAPLKLRLPLATVHGHAITAPLRQVDGPADPGPRAAVVDASTGISVTRLGQRLRVAGGTEFGGRAESIAPAALRMLYRVVDDWFPGAARAAQAQHWKGARAMLPDGPPALGASGRPGIWLNLGHGAHGWALACGCAQLLADQMAGRELPLDMTRLSAARFGAL